MPLPADNAPWPPPGWAYALDKMREHDAWYSGDPDRLGDVYMRLNSQAPNRSTAAMLNRPAQFRGGLVGKLARFWWGAPLPAGELSQRMHVPLASDLATTSADLLFGEPPQIGLAGQDQSATSSPALARLEDVLSGLDTLLNEAGEVAAALGGVYLRAGWDTEVSDRPILDAIHHDAGFPEFRRGQLVALTSVTVLEDNGTTVVRLVERNEPGVILHGLYRGKPDNLGTQIPLDRHPVAAAYVPSVEVPGGGLAVAYVPNMRPNRLDRGSGLGRSDYAGSEGVLDRLDEVYTSWIRDIRLAKGRLIVPAEFLETTGRGQGATFDLDREVYESLNIPPMAAQGAASPVTPNQFEIRFEAHRDTARELIEAIVRSAGYSAGTFGMDDQGAAVTATEITARERRSFVTRRKKINYWRPAVEHIARVAAQIDLAVFKQPLPPAPPTITWSAGVSEGQLTLAQTAQALRAADAASDATLVRLVHPDWDDDQVKAEVALIAGERQAAMPDLVPPPGSGSGN